MTLHEYPDLALVNGGGNSGLARTIARNLGVNLTPCDIESHRDHEPRNGPAGNFRNKHAVIVTSMQQPDRNFIVPIIQADIIRRASPRRITGIFTYYPYSRQDRHDQPRSAITVKIPAKLHAKHFDEIAVFDCHSEVTPALLEAYGDHHLAVDHLYSRELRLDWLLRDEGRLENATLMAMDTGYVKPVRSACRRLRGAGHTVRYCFADKDGTSSVGIEGVLLASDGHIEETDVYGFDDMSASGETAFMVSSAVRERHHPKSFTLFITHGVIPDAEAAHRLLDAPIDRIVVTDSVPMSEEAGRILAPKLVVESCAPLFTAYAHASYHGLSISRLFGLAGYRDALQELGLR